MNSGARKGASKGSAESGPSEPLDNDLLTSEDLFGDLVDAPPRVASPAPTARRGPIRVQVFDAVSDGPRPQALPPESADLLLDVVGGGEAQAPARPAPAPSGDVNAMLDALMPTDESEGETPAPSLAQRAVPPRAPDVSPLTGHAQEFESLLDGFGPDAVGAFESAPAAAPPRPTPAPRAPAPLLRTPTLPAAVPPEELSFEDAALGQAAVPALPQAPPAPPTTKFRAATAKPVPDEGALFDLKLVAESALRSPRTAPILSAETTPQPRARRRSEERESFGPYRLLERIAVGGMAEVFRAKRQGVEGFEKVVAVKRILPHLSDNQEFVDMFVHEAKMVAGLTHPNIVQIFDLGKLESSYYIAMELVHGRDLRSIQKRAQDRGVRVPLDLAALVVSKICSALEYAHRKKDDRGRPLQIVHRDVSPQNVLISFEGDVKLTDFGIAKAASKATTTDHGELRGKLLYMSPEQAWGHPIDKRADIFSLGVVFYELVTGHKPFLASSEGSILDAVRECRVAPPTTINPRIPDKLASVVMKALDRDPDQRYQDAAEMYRDLDRVLHERQVPSAPELSRLMSVLYDERERGDVVAEEDETHTSAAKLHVEFDSPARKAAVAGQDPSIEKLLKRFGIQ